MASSNVDYYQRQKDLQDAMHEHERRRIGLEEQLQSLCKTDSKLAQLRAAKLRTYWKKICDDQQRSQQRNEQLLQEYQRIDNFLAISAAKTERLKLLKRQYEEYIQRTYPQWMDQVIRQKQGDQSHSQQPANNSFIREPSPVQDLLLNQPQSQEQTTPKKPDISHAAYTQKEGRISTVQMSSATGGFTSTPHKNVTAGQKVPTKSSIYANISEVMKDPATQFHDLDEDDQPPSPVKVTQMQAEREQDAHVSSQLEDLSLSEEVQDQEEDMAKPIQSITVERIGEKKIIHPQPLESIDISKSLSGPMVPGDDEDDSEFDDDDDELPLSGRQAPLPPPVSGRESVQSESMYSSELSLDGILYMIRYIEEEIPHAIASEGFYHSSRPSPAERKDIIHKANIADDLASFDAEKVSMVVLEQLTPVIKSLNLVALWNDDFLSVCNPNTVTIQSIRKNMASTALPMWNSILHHMEELVKHKVMEAKEVASVFGPNIVKHDSHYQDKAHNIIVKVLEDAYPPEPNLASPREMLDSKSSMGGVIFGPDGKIQVPPLKFGSLVDSKMYSDDDQSTSMFTPSVPTDAPKIPINETAAYKSLLTGSQKQAQPLHLADDDDDTDDDVEKQFASALSPRDPPSSLPASSTPPNFSSAPLNTNKVGGRVSEPTSSEVSPVYVPTAVEGTKPSARSYMGSAAGSSTASKVVRKGGIFINSDVDTDTEVDIPVGKKEDDLKDDADDDDGFDFYG